MTSMPAIRVVARTLLLAGAAVIAYLVLALLDTPARADDGGLDLGDLPVVTLPDEAGRLPVVTLPDEAGRHPVVTLPDEAGRHPLVTVPDQPPPAATKAGNDAGDGLGPQVVGDILGTVADTPNHGTRDGDGTRGHAGAPPAGVHTGPVADRGSVPHRPQSAKQPGGGVDREAPTPHRPAATVVSPSIVGDAVMGGGGAGLDGLTGAASLTAIHPPTGTSGPLTGASEVLGTVATGSDELVGGVDDLLADAAATGANGRSGGGATIGLGELVPGSAGTNANGPAGGAAGTVAVGFSGAASGSDGLLAGAAGTVAVGFSGGGAAAGSNGLLAGAAGTVAVGPSGGTAATESGVLLTGSAGTGSSGRSDVRAATGFVAAADGAAATGSIAAAVDTGARGILGGAAGVDGLVGDPLAGATRLLEEATTHTFVGAVVEPILRVVYETTGGLLGRAVTQPQPPAAPDPVASRDQEAAPAAPQAPTTTTVPLRQAAAVVTAGMAAAGPRFGVHSSITKPPRSASAGGRPATDIGGAVPAPGPSGLGGCVPGGCAHTTDAVAAAGQPLVLPSLLAVRADARGRLVAPPAARVHAGRLPGVAPLPG